MNRRERIIELGAEIAAARAKLHVMEAELDGLLPPEEQSGQGAITPYKIEEDVPLPLTLTERVIKFLEQQRGRAFGASAIATGIGLSLDKMTSLRSTLVRLVQEERIARPSPGSYRAKQEQQHVAA
jgi:hypothetical protein